MEGLNNKQEGKKPYLEVEISEYMKAVPRNVRVELFNKIKKYIDEDTPFENKDQQKGMGDIMTALQKVLLSEDFGIDTKNTEE